MAMTQQNVDELVAKIKNTPRPWAGEIDYTTEALQAIKSVKREKAELSANGYSFSVDCITPSSLGKSAPLFIYIHGGGWFSPHTDNNTYYACLLAEKSGAVVLDVDYTTTETAPFAVMFAQCDSVVDYAVDNAVRLGCDVNRIVIGGFSAGGHLSAAVTLKRAKTGDSPLAEQILCYAPLDLRPKEYTDKDEANTIRGAMYEELLLRGDDSLRNDPFVSPAAAPDEWLQNCPRSLVISAGKCWFRFEDEAYAAKLASLGVETTVQRCLEAPHGFLPHFAGDKWSAATELIVSHIISAKK